MKIFKRRLIRVTTDVLSPRLRHLLGLSVLSTAVAFVFAIIPSVALAQSSIAITDVTVIDGTGAAPKRNLTVLVRDGQIAEISAGMDIPTDAERIDGSGKYLLPGFIDSNVHASVYGNSTRRETALKYGEHNAALALEFAQRQLKYGVTTVRDSYGALEPLIEVRDRINSGDALGARLLVAGNIVGWGGPFSMTFSLMQESELTLFQAQWNDHIAQGVGEELMDMGPEEVRVAINSYLNKGPDFIKYGGTSHFLTPSLIGFSPRVQKVIVDETHKRGLMAETHSTSSEALRLSVEAGVDLIQHPEILTRDYPDALINLIVERDVICALRSNTLTGRPWREHLKTRQRVEAELKNAPPPRTSAERRAREARQNLGYAIQRRNAERLIASGCRVTIATDNYQGRAPEFRKTAKPEIHEAGIGSILAIEGLVELGMSEMDAIVAATRNGAIAAGMLDQIGTLEVGKEADLLLLSANPLADISNIRQLDKVIARGRQVNIDAMPENIIFYTGPRPDGAVRPKALDATPQNARRAPMPIAAQATTSTRTTTQPRATTGDSRKALAIRNISKTALGKYVVELDNGEVWRQLNSDNTPVSLPSDTTGLTAEFKRTFAGSTTMKIKGTGRSFKVTPVR
ncbi:MAG: amidohydrolase family protein [Congregibacter sp.]